MIAARHSALIDCRSQPAGQTCRTSSLSAMMSNCCGIEQSRKQGIPRVWQAHREQTTMTHTSLRCSNTFLLIAITTELSTSYSTSTTMARLRLRHPKGASTIEIDLDTATVQDLLQKIREQTEIPPSQQDCTSSPVVYS